MSQTWNLPNNVFDQGDKEETLTVTTASGSTGFPLGTNRLPLDLENVSLVGRSSETIQLVEAYERIRMEDAPAEVILIRGESGTGKSVLVEYLERNERKGREFFITGKFQQYGQTRPYGGFVDATTELSFAIGESESLNDIRKVVLDTLTADDIQVLTSIMPTIEFIVPREKHQHDLDMHTNEQSFNRFMEVYRKFLQCICRQEHPLVLFLDDLQWVDDVSRQLIDSIAKDTKMRNLLVIGTVRQDPAITGVFDLSADTVLQCSEIVLGALTEEDVNCIVSDATARPPDETGDLAAVVYRKTGGNAYFVTQYLEMLHREELLVFSFKNTRWKWNTKKISSVTDVSDNVVQVLIRKIESLDVDAQVALMVAAYVGYSFRLDVVEFILGSQDFLHSIPGYLKEKNLELPMTNADTQIALTKAVRTGLIDKLSCTKCKFSHDRVQQSAYSMLPDGKERRCLQTALGRILLEMSRQSESEDWMLFAAVDLLSNGDVSTPESRKSASADGLALEMDEVDELLPRLCLEAAQKAAQKSAFRSAARYADEGISRLHSRDSQRGDYDMWLKLSNLSAEMHYCRGDFDASFELVDNILEGSRSVDDCFRAYNVSMSAYTSMEDWGAAISCGSRILSQLGVPTPKNPNVLNVVALLRKSKRLMKGKLPSDLEHLPPMDNPRMAQALYILGCSAFCSAGNGEEMRCVVFCLKMFLLTLEYGICSDSPYAFAAYGMCMSHTGEYAVAYEYGKLAVKMLERPGMEKSIAKVLVVVHSYLFFLKSPIQESLDPLLSGYTSGMRVGDVLQAAFCLRARACMGVFAGVHLVENEKEMLSFCEFYRDFKQDSSMKLQAPWQQLTLNFLGQADDVLKLNGSAMNEDSVFSELISSASSKLERNPNETFVLYDTHYAKRVLLYTFGEFEMAEKDRQRSERYSGESAILYTKLYDYLFCSLTCLAMARKGKRIRYYRRQAKAFKKELTARAKQGCVNCVPLLPLISAEERALTDKTGDIILYKEAIAMLGRCGFRLFKAIACERAGEYLLECGFKDRASEYLHQAWNEFYDVSFVLACMMCCTYSFPPFATVTPFGLT